jgi:hypothetical protein
MGLLLRLQHRLLQILQLTLLLLVFLLLLLLLLLLRNLVLSSLQVLLRERQRKFRRRLNQDL